MQPFYASNEKLGQWMKMEQYRLQCVEMWPDSPYKQAVLCAIRSSLERLTAASPATAESPNGILPAPHKTPSAVLEFPAGSQDSPALTRLAA
jgi:hypothetical protein